MTELEGKENASALPRSGEDTSAKESLLNQDDFCNGNVTAVVRLPTLGEARKSQSAVPLASSVCV